MRADSAAPCHVDKPGGAISGISMSLSVSGLVTRPMLINMFIGPSGLEYPSRFFARDYAGNLLEFSV